MNDVQVVIYPEMFTSEAIRADSALLNINARYIKAGFFEKIRLRRILDEFIKLKEALVSNPYHALIISSDLADNLNKWASEGSVLSVTGFASQNTDDDLFNFDPPKRDDST